MEVFYCGGTHRALLPRSHFFPGSLRAGETRCKQCNTAARLQRRRSDPVRWLQLKLYQYERKRCAPSPYPSRALIESLLMRYPRKGSVDPYTLCVVRFYPDLPVSEYPWNAVLLTAAEARCLPRAPVSRRLTAFPAALQREMHLQRYGDLSCDSATQ